MKRLATLLSAVFCVAACHRYATPESGLRSNLDAELTAALERNAEGQGLDFFRLPDSDDFASIPQDAKNPLTSAKVELGRLLFHETALGGEPKLRAGHQTYSCASCHDANAGFQSGIIQGIGEGGLGFGEGRMVDPKYPTDSVDVKPIRTPSTLNVAYQPNVLWNGGLGATHLNQGTKFAWMPGTPLAFNRFGFEGPETVAIAAIGLHRMTLEGLVDRYPEYKRLFDLAFPDTREDRRYTRRFAGLAIGAYERTLLANNAPFQEWLRGDHRAMSPVEKQGAVFFFGKAKCVQCHTGPALNSMQFAALGMKDLFQDRAALNAAVDSLPNLGRASFTRRGTDLFQFKVPQLYNLIDAPFYGHGGSFTEIRDIVSYKNRAQPENPNVRRRFLSDQFQPLGLTEADIDALTAFLTSALRDSTLVRYLPERLPSGGCLPNNDSRSQADLGCR